MRFIVFITGAPAMRDIHARRGAPMARLRIAPARRPPLRAVAGAAHSQAEVPLYPADHGYDCDRRASLEVGAARLARERASAVPQRCID